MRGGVEPPKPRPDKGLGRIRHIEVRYLWIQDMILEIKPSWCDDAHGETFFDCFNVWVLDSLSTAVGVAAGVGDVFTRLKPVLWPGSGGRVDDTAHLCFRVLRL